MYTSKQCTYKTCHDPKPDDNLSSGFITYIINYPSKSWNQGREGAKGENLWCHR